MRRKSFIGNVVQENVRKPLPKDGDLKEMFKIELGEMVMTKDEFDNLMKTGKLSVN